MAESSRTNSDCRTEAALCSILKVVLGINTQLCLTYTLNMMKTLRYTIGRQLGQHWPITRCKARQGKAMVTRSLRCVALLVVRIRNFYSRTVTRNNRVHNTTIANKLGQTVSSKEHDATLERLKRTRYVAMNLCLHCLHTANIHILHIIQREEQSRQ